MVNKKVAKKKTSKSKAITLPWQQALAKYAEQGKAPKEAPAMGDIIGTKGGKFSLGDRALGRELDCVIIGWCFARSYSDADEYVEGASPACFAIDFVEESMSPHDTSPVVQSSECGECTHNEWGSGKGDSKAC